MVTQCGQPESRVAGSGGTEAGGWRPRPALPPSLPAEPGQKDARSSRKRRNQTQPNTEREIPMKWRPNPKNQPSNRPKGRRRTEGDRRGSRAQGPGTKTEAGNRPGEQDRASPDLHRHHKTRYKEARPQGTAVPKQEPRKSERKRNATPQYQDDSKYFTKKTRSDSTSATDPLDTPPTVAWTRDRTLVPRHPEPEGEWRSTTSQRQNLGQTRKARTDNDVAPQAGQEDWPLPQVKNVLPCD